VIERLLGEPNAQSLRRTPGTTFALLDHLGADEVMLAPVAFGGEPKGFLVLDHAYSLAGLGGEDSGAEISALAGVTSLLLDVLRMRSESARTRRFAEMDGLTHLYNRRTGLELFEREIIRSRRSRTPLSVLMVDLDAFKALNDRLGHLAGDSVLRTVARVLRNTFRRSDILCRYGGEEFIVVQPETELEEATMAAARLFKAVETAGIEIGVPITVSIGVTAVNPGDPVETAIQRADLALYASKDRGKNRFSVDSGT
jgi:diguanylate cyclase (GGDEF)-like protein